MRNPQSWSSLCMIDCHRSSIQKLEAYLMFDGHGTEAFSPSIAWGLEYLNDRIVNRACSQLFFLHLPLKIRLPSTFYHVSCQ